MLHILKERKTCGELATESKFHIQNTHRKDKERKRISSMAEEL